MHSAMEACGVFDYNELINALKKYFETHINISNDGFIVYE